MQASPNYHDHNQNEVVTLPLNNPDGSQKLQLTFGMREAGNDWWWAIDNLVINAGVVPPLIATQPSGTEVSEGDAFALSVVAEGGEPLELPVVQGRRGDRRRDQRGLCGWPSERG